MPSTVVYRGTCDASAAVRLGSSLFVSASDEDYILRVYDHEAPGMPGGTVDLAPFLEPDDPGKEPDIEGAAAIGDRIYWVTSHGRNKDREEQESRQRFFATSVVLTDDGVRIGPVGRPYKHLVRDLITARELGEFDLQRASTLAPEELGGLNLEGLAPTPDGHLLLGFRNPVPDGLALIVAMRNPAEVIDRSAPPALAVAGRLDLGGRGIRAIEFVPEAKTCLVIAGAHDDAHDFRMYRWSGLLRDGAIALDIEMEDCKPEELIVTAARGRTYELQLLSDDGDRDVGGTKCKKARLEQRSFRGLTTTIEL
ncbi:MAG TPA: DUF3616 domain-containing protein [Vicinamibacterales bacterium]|nr:DUF3616 domain-containing protein [Vicinamibacterales bacterium]